LSPFLFESHAHNRNLHSFPTRRSSDLSGKRICAVAQKRSGTRSKAARRAAKKPRSIRISLFNRQTYRKRDSTMPRFTARAKESGDRKSTRLNSSHVSISYAVFCLKKKK